MPIYEYQCQACGHEIEKLQRISDERLKDCPDCGEAELHRLVSAAGFRLKGGGWYETDFKKGEQRNLHESGASKDSSSPSVSKGSSASAAKKTENKPQASSSDSA